jgi:hypothetical protein
MALGASSMRGRTISTRQLTRRDLIRRRRDVPGHRPTPGLDPVVVVLVMQLARDNARYGYLENRRGVPQGRRDGVRDIGAHDPAPAPPRPGIPARRSQLDPIPARSGHRRDAAVDHAQCALTLFQPDRRPMGNNGEPGHSRPDVPPATPLPGGHRLRLPRIGGGAGHRQPARRSTHVVHPGQDRDDTGRVGAASRSWQRALGIFEQLDAPQAAKVRDRLGALRAADDARQRT